MRLSTFVKLAVVGAGIVAVAMISASKSIDFERYKGYLAHLVEVETGRKLTFGGPVRLRLGLVPSLIAENVTLSNVAGASRPEMIKVERVEAEVALPALLRKEILIQRLIVSSPDILLEKGNWRLVDSGRDGGAGTPTRFNLRELKIKNARVTWIDGDKRQSVALHKLVVVPEQGAGSGLGVNVVGDTLGKTFEFTGKVGNLGAALAGKPWPLTLKGAMPGTIVSVDGAIGSLADLAGLDLKLGLQSDDMADVLRLVSGHGNGPLGPMRLSARLSDPGGVLGLSEVDFSAGRRDGLFAAVKGGVRDLAGFSGLEAAVQVEADNLARLAGVLGVDLPALAAVRMTATLRDSKNGWAASEFKAHVGGSDLTGEGALVLAPRPQLRAGLTAAQITVADFVPRPSGSGSGDGRLIPPAALPLDMLRGHDAEIALRAERLTLGHATLTGFQAELRLRGGQLSVEPLRAALAGGEVEGGLTLDARPALPAAGLRLNGSGIEFGRLARDWGVDWLSGGTGSFKTSLRGRGTGLRQLAAGASGQMLVEMGPGQIRNRAFSLAGADVVSQLLGGLNPLADSRDATPLACAVLHLRLRNGVAATDRGIALRAEGIDLVGSGTVTLGDESLDLGFTPRATEGLGLSVGGQLAGLTRLRGTLAAPELSVDEIGAARTALSVGAAAATGGLSLLGELLLDKVTADGDPCRTALAMGGTSSAKGRAPGLLEGLFGR